MTKDAQRAATEQIRDAYKQLLEVWISIAEMRSETDILLRGAAGEPVVYVGDFIGLCRDTLAARSEIRATVRVEAQDKVPMAYLVRASGEGSTDHRLCLTPWDVRTAYVDFVVGACDPAHKDEVDNVMAQFEDEEQWAENILRIELYCAVFEVTRFPAGVL